MRQKQLIWSYKHWVYTFVFKIKLFFYLEYVFEAEMFIIFRPLLRIYYLRTNLVY